MAHSQNNSKNRIVQFFLFIQLNAYAILIICIGMAILLIPLFKISMWFILAQVFAFAFALQSSIRLFSKWGYRKKMIKTLLKINHKEFKTESFEPFMDAPCSRLVVKRVLKILGAKKRYKELKIYQPSIIINCKETQSVGRRKVVVYKLDATATKGEKL